MTTDELIALGTALQGQPDEAKEAVARVVADLVVAIDRANRRAAAAESRPRI